MIFNSDATMGTYLLDVYDHLEKNYDNCILICGDTGTGKSMLGLHIFETWYKVILKQEIKTSMIDQVNTDFTSFVKKFKELKEYDMAIFDEGAVQLDSKAHMEKLSRQITKLYNVFRVKKFFTIIILPSYFNLNKYFREHRLRGCIWVNKRGEYKLFTQQGVNWLNAMNERRNLKSMHVAYPIHTKKFPDYKGILREPYEKRKMEGVDRILDEVIADGERVTRKYTPIYETIKDDVAKLLKKGCTWKEMQTKLEVSKQTLSKAISLIKYENDKGNN